MNNLEKEFFETFGIEAEEHEVPGHDWDEDGLASWYIEKMYPMITDEVVVELMCLREALNKQPVSNIWSREIPTKKELISDLLWDLIWYQKHTHKRELKAKVQDIINKCNSDTFEGEE